MSVAQVVPTFAVCVVAENPESSVAAKATPFAPKQEMIKSPASSGVTLPGCAENTLMGLNPLAEANGLLVAVPVQLNTTPEGNVPVEVKVCVALVVGFGTKKNVSAMVVDPLTPNEGPYCHTLPAESEGNALFDCPSIHENSPMIKSVAPVVLMEPDMPDECCQSKVVVVPHAAKAGSVTSSARMRRKRFISRRRGWGFWSVPP